MPTHLAELAFRMSAAAGPVLATLTMPAALALARFGGSAADLAPERDPGLVDMERRFVERHRRPRQ